MLRLGLVGGAYSMKNAYRGHKTRYRGYRRRAGRYYWRRFCGQRRGGRLELDIMARICQRLGGQKVGTAWVFYKKGGTDEQAQ